MEFIQKELIVNCGEKKIFGLLHMPKEHDGSLPLVIMSHGIYASHQMTGKSADVLAVKGIACYCFDFYGGSYSRKSGGTTLEFSVLTEVEELSAVIDTVANLDFVDREKVFLYGESLGGAVTILTAAKRPQGIAGLILMYPAIHAAEVFRTQYPDGNFPEVLENALGAPGLNLSRKFFEDVVSVDFESSMAGYKNPVFITHGTDDKLVPVSYGEKAANTFPNATIKIIPGAPHGYPLDEGLATEVLEFIKTN